MIVISTVTLHGKHLFVTNHSSLLLVTKSLDSSRLKLLYGGPVSLECGSKLTLCWVREGGSVRQAAMAGNLEKFS